jgi:RNA polymerase sigma factor (sigma-70 family)
VLLKCALSFDPTRDTKFSTWLGNYAKYTCLNYINSKKYTFHSETEELHKYIEETVEAPFTEEFTEESKIVFQCLKKLKDKRIEKIFKMRYFYGRKKESTWKVISGNIGVSIQTAINLHKKGLRLLKNQIGKKVRK